MKHLLATAFVLGLSAAAFAVTPTIAQTLIDGTDFDAVVNSARGYGAATLEKLDDDIYIDARIDGVPYYLGFRNCDGELSCDDFVLQAYYIGPEIDYIKVNTWNYDKRWVKMYIDDDGDAILEMDVNLTGGISTTTLDEAFYYWSLALAEFADLFDSNGVMSDALAPAANENAPPDSNGEETPRGSRGISGGARVPGS